MSHIEQAEWSDRQLCGFDIVAGQFVVVTADAADIEEYEPLKALLRRVRKAFGLDCYLVCEFAHDQQVVRTVGFPGAEVSPHDVLEASYGQALLGAAGFESVSVAGDSLVYGTLCCCIDGRMGACAVRSVARLIADWFTGAELTLSGLMPLRGQSVMGSLPMGLH